MMGSRDGCAAKWHETSCLCSGGRGSQSAWEANFCGRVSCLWRRSGQAAASARASWCRGRCIGKGGGEWTGTGLGGVVVPGSCDCAGALGLSRGGGEMRGGEGARLAGRSRGAIAGSRVQRSTKQDRTAGRRWI
ncbi:hypothetical protein PMIN01_04945 [Paraphaeosphaeria minitans]|uniref:Uncharacterized protein n=1 Tax=Paraphaeosphaeria minitans TaxID=565426 RepID=A0A9P6GK68_9PLEO|nr:hypothetical protein PMIN01_04945 [Paraphaeosphaeria minitans]